MRAALDVTDTADLHRSVDELSGGQRQRVRIAMALAQETELLLLNEPTTFLDISHQIDVLELVAALRREAGRTIVVVLHDLNLACRYADHVVAMRNGVIVVGAGAPAEIVTAERVQEVFGLECVVIDDPASHNTVGDPARCGRTLQLGGQTLTRIRSLVRPPMPT